MLHDPKNKVIVVTGGANGIGYAIADQFLQNDAKTVIILDIDEAEGKVSEEKLNSKNGAGRAIFIKCDVCKDLDAVTKEIFEKYNVNVLVNSAGVLEEYNPRKVLEVNVVSLVECSMKFWEHMRTDKGGVGGTIVNVGSTFCFKHNLPYLVFYRTSKFAVMSFTESLGHKTNYEQFGVRTIVLCPGMAKTKMTAKQMCWDEHLEVFQELLKTVVPQTADDVGIAAIDIYKKAESGTSWSIIGGVVSKVK